MACSIINFSRFRRINWIIRSNNCVLSGKICKRIKFRNITPEDLGGLYDWIKKMKFSLRIASFSAPIIALAISFGLSSLILLFIGKDPIETFPNNV